VINSEFNIKTTNRPALLCMLPSEPEAAHQETGPFSPLIEITEWVEGDAGADIAYCTEFGTVNLLPLGEKAIEGLLNTLLLRKMLAQGQVTQPGAGNPVSASPLSPTVVDLMGGVEVEREPTDEELQAIEREEAAQDDYNEWNNEAPVVNGTYGMTAEAQDSPLRELSGAEIAALYPKCPGCGEWHYWKRSNYPPPPGMSPPVTRAGSPPPFVE
jgi:hypothetical protein